MYRSLLVPLDATSLSVDVVGKAVSLAHALGARITFFHALAGGGPAAADEPGALRFQGCGDPDHPGLGLAHELLSKAEAAARAFGVPCDSRCTTAVRPAPAIIEVARTQGCDLIFMASHGLRARPGQAPTSDTLAVVMDAGLPVLVSSAVEPEAPARAIAVIRDEHRALSAALHGWTRLLARQRTDGVGVEAEPMRDFVRYLQTMQATLHHPREERHVFSRLRQRTQVVDADLDELERQHLRDGALLADLEGRVEALEQSRGLPARLAAAQALDTAVQRYADIQWEHMGREEAVVLPAARRYLTGEDWAAIDDAYASDPAIRDGSEAARAAQQLLVRILKWSQDPPSPARLSAAFTGAAEVVEDIKKDST